MEEFDLRIEATQSEESVSSTLVEIRYENKLDKYLTEAFELAGLEIEILKGEKEDDGKNTKLKFQCEKEKFEFFFSIIISLLIQLQHKESGSAPGRNPLNYPINLN